MRPLRKGAARTGLINGLKALAYFVRYGPEAAGKGDEVLDRTAELEATILGGAVVQTCKDMGIDEEIFFRYTNENVWRLTRALKASNLLDKVVD